MPGPTWQQMMKEDRKRDMVINYTVLDFKEINYYIKQVKKMMKDCEIKNIDFSIKINYYYPENTKNNKK